jgi:hypothetical protein
MIIDNCPVCEPITTVVELLQKLDHTIIHQELQDYHFRQVLIRTRGPMSALSTISVKEISRENNKFTCTCHWSTIECEDSK